MENLLISNIKTLKSTSQCSTPKEKKSIYTKNTPKHIKKNKSITKKTDLKVINKKTEKPVKENNHVKNKRKQSKIKKNPFETILQLLPEYKNPENKVKTQSLASQQNFANQWESQDSSTETQKTEMKKMHSRASQQAPRHISPGKANKKNIVTEKLLNSETETPFKDKLNIKENLNLLQNKVKTQSIVSQRSIVLQQSYQRGSQKNSTKMQDIAYQQISQKGSTEAQDIKSQENSQRVGKTFESIKTQLENSITYMSNNNRKQVVLKLTPEHLGKVEINISMIKKDTKVEIKVQKHETLELLQNNQTSLRDLFSSIKKTGNDISFSFDKNTNSESNQENNHNKKHKKYMEIKEKFNYSENESIEYYAGLIEVIV